MAKKQQKAIQDFLQGLCALIFLLPGVPEGLSRCLGSLLMATPQPTLFEVHMWAYYPVFQVETGDGASQQFLKGKRNRMWQQAAAATQVTIKTKPRHLEQHRPKSLFSIQ